MRFAHGSRKRALVVAALAAGTMVLTPPALAGHKVNSVTGSAYGYYTNASFFGGPYNSRGPSPSVTLPSNGGNVSATDSDGDSAVYGPAVLFQSGAMTASSSGSTGNNGSVTSSVDVDGYQDPSESPPDADGDGPGPFIFQNAAATCSANKTSSSGSATIDGGILETAYDPMTGDPTSTESVPTNPSANYTRTGTIDHVGDSYTVVFNEQTVAADGTRTVTAAHIYMEGPTALGDIIIGRVVCDVTLHGE